MPVLSRACITMSRTTAVTIVLGAVFSSPVRAQQAPPDLGQETKGTPAVEETTVTNDNAAQATPSTDPEPSKIESEAGIDGLLGEAQIIESKRENGQVYRIQLNHSSGATQYIEETDSDGKIKSTSNDIEETPNLPKWKLGSW